LFHHALYFVADAGSGPTRRSISAKVISGADVGFLDDVVWCRRRRNVVIAVTLVIVAGREARSCGGPDRAIVMS
jgi:hypothetical protein